MKTGLAVHAEGSVELEKLAMLQLTIQNAPSVWQCA